MCVGHGKQGKHFEKRQSDGRQRRSIDQHSYVGAHKLHRGRLLSNHDVDGVFIVSRVSFICAWGGFRTGASARTSHVKTLLIQHCYVTLGILVYWTGPLYNTPLRSMSMKHGHIIYTDVPMRRRPKRKVQ